MHVKVICLLSIFLLTGCCSTQKKHLSVDHKVATSSDVFAVVNLEPKSGSDVRGNAWFKKGSMGLEVKVKIFNATPGLHGIHIHEFGDCSAADASSAGSHYNPTHLVHGKPDPKKYHAGDLGNIEVGRDGSGTLDIVIPQAHFNPEFTDYSNVIGKSLVVHEKTDDLKSQPSGDSGDRIACGVIAKE